VTPDSHQGGAKAGGQHGCPKPIHLQARGAGSPVIQTSQEGQSVLVDGRGA